MRAVGYAELFVLSREDVLSALADHPDAHVSTFCHSRVFPAQAPSYILPLRMGVYASTYTKALCVNMGGGGVDAFHF